MAVTYRVNDLDYRVAPGQQIVTLNHNLPALSGGALDFYLVQALRGATPDAIWSLSGAELQFPLNHITASEPYKLLALRFNNGIADGCWWHENYVYDPAQINLAFTSGSAGGGVGAPVSLAGRTLVNKSPVSRRVVAVAIDGEAPLVLAQAQSDSQGRYLLEWAGYSGQVIVIGMDDYGVAFSEGASLGSGERVHPLTPNGYVYEVVTSGTLGAEPVWPQSQNETVQCGDCLLVALPFYRPSTAGPLLV